ncbi:MAG TPA: sulfatase [Tepidisphaeraceae bacterium]|jgi:arylsulfatase A-like enzyme|nr:sulfatase [Tepidisphaeraceae bacterium]
MRSNLLSFALFLFCLISPVFAAKPPRPNFLFIYTDDQRWDAMGVVQREQGSQARFPWLQTPNMDRLAREGMLFHNAFVVDSLCAPARADFLSGQYNHINGVVNNHTPFPLTDITSSALLTAAGYDTAYFGKWHHGLQVERPGFTYIASFLGQGKYYDCPINLNGVMTPTKGRIDDVTTDYAIDYLQHHDPNKPFDLVVGYKAPHEPRTPAEQDRHLYTGDEIRPPTNAEPRAIFLPPHPPTSLPTDKSPADWKLDYFRVITSTDRTLGRLLDALDTLHLTENTIVIYCTDNGFYMGEHGLNDKRSAYDDSLRIPFIVRYPKLVKPGSSNDAMVLNIDLAPTLLDFAGLPIPAEMQGRSFRPLLTNPDATWRHSFLYEYFHERGYASPYVLAVRTAAAKLVTYPGHPEWTELFDLSIDPGEKRNLISDPTAAPLRVDMQAELQSQLKATGYDLPKTVDPLDPNNPGHF